MGHVRPVSRLTKARLGYASGLLAAAAGAGLEFGPGWALLGGGLAAAASFLTLADTDDEGGGGSR